MMWYSLSFTPSKRKILIIFLLSSLVILLFYGILGVGRSSNNNVDGAVLYAAGRTWLNGENPYNHNQLSQSIADVKEIGSLRGFGFFYPPQSAPLCLTLALLDYHTAKIVLLVLNLSALAAIVAMNVYTIQKYTSNTNREVIHLATWVMSAVIIGNIFTSHVIWMGQTSLLAFAAAMAAWLCYQRHKWLLAGVFLGLASFKPQLCVLIVLWLLFEREWKTLVIFLGTIGILTIYPMIVHEPLDMVIDWYEGIQNNYQSLSVNRPGYSFLMGLESFFAATGLTFKYPIFKGLGFLMLAIAWMGRQKINRSDILGILMTITVTFIGSIHDYDYVCLMPAIASILVYSLNQKEICFITIPLVLLLLMPPRPVEALGIHILTHWRTLVVMIIMIVLPWLSIRDRYRCSLKGNFL